MGEALMEQQIADMVAESSAGTLTAKEALDSSSSLLDKGFSSLAFLTLIDKLEMEYGVYIDLEADTTFLGYVPRIAEFVRAETRD